MNIDNAVALVTGAGRGIGHEFVTQLLARGAKVYAGVRDPSAIDLPGVTVLEIDVTDQASVSAAAAAAGDTTLLINNAGIATFTDLVVGDLDKLHLEMDTNVFGTLRMIREFAPVLAANGGGAVLNMLSTMSWITYPGANVYAMSKAAAWMLTNGVRLELTDQHTLVTGVHVGAVDTDMMAAIPIYKLDPAVVVSAALDGLEAGDREVLVDEATSQIKQGLIADPGVVYPATFAG